MANNIDDLAIEMASAKEKLKDINNTINRDRAVMAELEKSIEGKKSEIKGIEQELAEKRDEIASLDILKKDKEKEFGDIRDGLKAEIKKLSDNKKKDEEKYQISIEELSNDIRVLTGRKTALNNEIADLEKAKREASVAKEQGIAEKDLEIKKVEEKLNNFTLLFEKQNADYNKVAGEIEDMNKRLEEESSLCDRLAKLERDIEEKDIRLVEVKDEVIEAEDKLTEMREELKKLEQDKIDAAAEIADYVKKKMDIKERKDQLEIKEKYLRKRFEEAGINFD